MKVGQTTRYGRVGAILWLGERYYLCIRDGVVSLMPAVVFGESTGQTDPDTALSERGRNENQ